MKSQKKIEYTPQTPVKLLRELRPFSAMTVITIAEVAFGARIPLAVINLCLVQFDVY